MNHSRRGFLGVMAAGAGSLAFGRAAAARPLRFSADEAHFDWKPLSEDVWIAYGEGGNSLVLVGRTAAALVDCKNAPFGATLRREAEAKGAPVKLVINTHHHADHTGGNHAFSKDVPIVAHEKCKARIAPQMGRYVGQAKGAAEALQQSDKPGVEKVREDVKAFMEAAENLQPANFEPKIAVEEFRELEVGGERIVLRHYGPGHTDNDLVVYLPRRNIVHMGDLLFHKRHPFVDRAGGATTEGWIASLRKAAELCDSKSVVVPGHGERTDISGLKLQSEYFHAARELVERAIKDGKSKEDTARLDLPAPFAAYERPQGKAMVLSAIYDELTEAR